MLNVSQINVGNNTYDIKDATARSDLANKQDIIQKTTLPTASSTEEGNIYQYIGATGSGLTNGYFYKCVENSDVYSWQAIDVQAGGGGSVSGKADKVSNATEGNLAGLDATGNLTDSGKKASDFATAAQGGKADSAIQTIQIDGTAQTKTNGVVNLPAYPTTLPASNTTSSYSASGTAPVNGTAVAAALGTLDVSSVGGSGKYIQSISETDGKISATAADMPTSLPASDVSSWAKASTKPSYTATEVGAADSNHTHTTNDITALTGYTIASSAAAIAATDSLNTALGKLQKSIDGKGTSNLTIGTTGTTAAAGNHTHSGYAATTHNQASNTINAMTGYSKPSATSAINISDTLNSAIGKLEKKFDGLSPILQTDSLTLTVAGWVNNQQTVQISDRIPTANRNVIDIVNSGFSTSFSEQTWADYGVVPTSYSIVQRTDSIHGAAECLNSITFTCETVPDVPLYFQITSMEVSSI